jgi:hypothetical protein
MSQIEDLNEKLAKHRAHGKSQDGATYLVSEYGPVGYSLIDSIIVVLEAQEATIAQLEQRVAKLERDQVS